MRKLLQTANSRVTASMLVMGLGQLLYKQWGKGLLFLAVQLGYIYYLVTIGARDLFGFFTLGSVETNPWYGVEGDNSVVMLIMGVLAWIVTILYIVVYSSNIKDVSQSQISHSFRWPGKQKTHTNEHQTGIGFDSPAVSVMYA